MKAQKKKQKNINKFFIENYKKSWKYLGEIKNYILFAIILFLFFLNIGLIFPVFFKQEIFSFMQEILEQISKYNLFELICFIFFNNLKASFFAFVLGIFFGIFPIITAIVNGYLIGFVARYTVAEGGLLVLWRLLPHGIFELPAAIISIAIGIKLGVVVLKQHNWKSLKDELTKGLMFFILIIIPLLIIAAIIEGILIFFLK